MSSLTGITTNSQFFCIDGYNLMAGNFNPFVRLFEVPVHKGSSVYIFSCSPLVCFCSAVIVLWYWWYWFKTHKYLSWVCDFSYEKVPSTAILLLYIPPGRGNNAEGMCGKAGSQRWLKFLASSCKSPSVQQDARWFDFHAAVSFQKQHIIPENSNSLCRWRLISHYIV